MFECIKVIKVKMTKSEGKRFYMMLFQFYSSVYDRSIVSESILKYKLITFTFTNCVTYIYIYIMLYIYCVPVVHMNNLVILEMKNLIHLFYNNTGV